jgi:hypothetical protein
MTGQPLRLTLPDELPAPRTDTDSATVLAEAVDTLAALRTPYWLGDNAVALHALASLLAEAEHALPTTVQAARDQGHTWGEIGQLLNPSPKTAARRYRTPQRST